MAQEIHSTLHMHAKFVWSTFTTARSHLRDVQRRFAYLSAVPETPGISSYLALDVHAIRDDPDLVEIRFAQDAFWTVLQDVPHTAEIMASLASLQAAAPIIGISSECRVTEHGGEYLIVDWGNTYLKTGCVTFDCCYMNSLTPKAIPDLLVKALLECGKKPPNSITYIPTLLNEQMSKRDVFTWFNLIAPDECRRGDCPGSVIVGTILSDPLWRQHVKIVSAISSRSTMKLLQAIKMESANETLYIPQPDRVAVYSFLLGVNQDEVVNTPLCSTEEEIGIGFGRISGRCWNDPYVHVLAEKFKNRVLRDDCADMVRNFLEVIDKPLHGKLYGSKETSGVIKRLLIDSIFSPVLADSVLAKLWDALLLAPPEMLTRVIGLTLVEMRELILNCESSRDLEDVLMSTGELIENFHCSIVMLAMDSTDIGIADN